MLGPRRVAISSACAVVGVSLLLAAVALPAEWYPALPLFLGLGFIGVSHVLTPCQDQMTRWWRRLISRIS
jgi:hypothetical protein